MGLKLPKWLKKVIVPPAIPLPPPLKDVGHDVVTEVVSGENPSDAIKSASVATAEDWKEASAKIAGLEAKLEAAKLALVGRLGGDGGQDWFEDLQKILKPATAETAAAGFGAVEEFLRTGNIEALNPMVPYFAAEVRRVRDTYWDRAHSIPAAVVAAMPGDTSADATRARTINVAETHGELNLPRFAIQHLDRASALAAIDLIFFKEEPGGENVDDLHYWCHEIWHVHQYAEWGVEGFVRRYIAQLLKSSDPGANEVEVAADLFACKHFFIAHPHYIGVCPIGQ